MPLKPCGYPVYSQRDVLDAYRNYDASPETKEPILWFLSELTGMSIDSIAAYIENGEGGAEA